LANFHKSADARKASGTLYLEACEKYNGGVVDKDEEQIKTQLSKIIESLSKTFPDALRFTTVR
jgi:sister-chromatid-cohesion protein PDS5